VVIARSFWRKSLVTAIAAGAFASVYEVTILDSKNATERVEEALPPAAGVASTFGATAYCKGLTTASGVAVQSGILAADPGILPVGSVVQLAGPDPSYDGVYTVLDTGPEVQGRLIDIYIWNCNEALKFGRRPVRLTPLRVGWDPHATTPRFLERLLRARTPEKHPLPARPLPQVNVGDALP
jgi:3D (Asp-Asp-Asp) domain-containing protein